MRASDLHDAAAGRTLETRYQPIVRLADGEPVGFEVLVRLNHPNQGLLPPDFFIPQIEASGLAAQLTETVGARVFADMKAAPAGCAHLTIALNVPLDVLLTPRNMAVLEASRKRAGIAAERIVLELTESKPVADLPALGMAIGRLRRAGYGVAIDDVAPSVPHHQAMMALPFTALKLDKSVVQQAAYDDAARAFATHAIESAKMRGLTVVAEGVEDAATWKHMAALGADEAQGFFVARPLPFTALPLWLETWSARPADM